MADLRSVAKREKAQVLASRYKFRTKFIYSGFTPRIK
jgi:hypothetical protein